jgi:hypothetical protein
MDISIKECSNISDTTDTSPKEVRSPKSSSHFKKLQLQKSPAYQNTLNPVEIDDDFEDIKELIQLISTKSVQDFQPLRETISSPTRVHSPKNNKRDFVIRKKIQPISPRFLKVSRNK